MRYLRTKGIRKALRQFHFLCGIKAPYKVLLDGNFIVMCIKMKVNVYERVPKHLQVKADDCVFYVPRAALDELQLLNETTKEAYEMAKSFKLVESCSKVEENGSDKVVEDVAKAIQSIIGDKNERKFVVCTQDVNLRKALRLVPGVPLMYLNRSVVVFEEISRATLAIVRHEDRTQHVAKLNVNEKRKLEQVEVGEERDVCQERKRLQKKRAKGPNPLSVKKPTHKKIRAKKIKNTMH
ncbi:hypothetical protein PsorP6_000691 [Peronosclerospora sorghi]|uniref:Uncharacterized protein n=1 Tax=Peronosclerospora sorghi TaxID=230839 RepID=A0ACC0WRQ1_9STRA|nr:hypothetical protein PsorP6_000691 [Peronosclerospora sorghi]